MRHKYLNLILPALFVFALNVTGQEQNEYEDMLQRIDTVENPIYMPHLSVGYGVLNFMGEVRTKSGFSLSASRAYKASLATYIDNAHFITANFYFMGGVLAGELRSIEDLSKNLNFSTSITNIGAAGRYEFGHFFPSTARMKPYVSLGLELINFNPSPKGDLFDAENNRYYYWDDGTIRSSPQGQPGAAILLERDYVYETDLRKYERDNFNLGNYSSRSVGIPLELGISLNVTRNIYMSIGTEYHYTFTDFIDNVASEGTHVAGDKMEDSYFYTHATIHFDLFSDPTTRTVDLLYADVEFDPLLFEDEDGDFVLDIADRCPGTPYGVVTDTLGCPLDSDNDGIPDYMDKEEGSVSGIWVDEDGVTISEEEFLSRLGRDTAMIREDVAAYMALYNSINWDKNEVEVPEKFNSFDIDGDGYIAFEELLLVVDAYFDYEIDLSLEELHELNEFFFSQ
ncbi:MAG TPA: hypothetical protein VJ951_15350 [Bacteroidales bacterium]|nr:hypothetical protein [Bacteroidales bacterium]